MTTRDPETNLEILPCVCGEEHPAEAAHVPHAGGFIVHCSNDETCARQTMPYPSRSDAIDAWNAREFR
jgi:hypothetical protein